MKTWLLLMASLFSITSFAQVSVPNGYSKRYEEVDGEHFFKYEYQSSSVDKTQIVFKAFHVVNTKQKDAYYIQSLHFDTLPDQCNSVEWLVDQDRYNLKFFKFFHDQNLDYKVFTSVITYQGMQNITANAKQIDFEICGERYSIQGKDLEGIKYTWNQYLKDSKSN